METQPFYNTTGLPLDELKDLIASAKVQNERVLLILKAKTFPLTSFKIWGIYKSWWPSRIKEESLRRSLSNLSKSGNVIKCKEKEMGGYGIEIHKWRLA